MKMKMENRMPPTINTSQPIPSPELSAWARSMDAK
jgi:hypothetical protein